MCPLQYYQIMRNCKDKKHHRYQLVCYAQEHGNKPAARAFNTSPQVTRKWVRRFKLGGYQALGDRSRRPHSSPQETPPELKEHIVALKKKYKRLGAEQIKILERVSLSAKTMRKIWRKAGLKSRKRRKKHITKNNLREIKKKYQLFQRACEDTKDLTDIPEYWLQMKSLDLPQVQYTYREVSCGVQFLGFANECSLTHATLFAKYLNWWFRKLKVPLPQKANRQTDNGSEYVGSWNAKSPSSYTLEVESWLDQTHTTIFPGAHRMQADVETVHNLIEMEFYEIETFKDRQDFLNKAYTYLLFFNLQRPNTYKEGKTPWQLAQEKIPQLDKRLLMIPPVDLDALIRSKIDFFQKGGNNVLTVP
jgi:transposase